MIKYYRIFITFLLTAIAFGASAQSAQTISTSSSPYSRYGLGDIDPALLPQNRAMGGIGTAINRISGYNNINPLNPASYGAINYTTIDVGIYSNITSLSQYNQTGSTDENFRLSHVAFAIPVSKHSALSFGLLPYSEMGYNNLQTRTGFGTKSAADTNVVNYISNGNGGLSRAYLGYGFGIGKHLMLGANASYIFGNLQQTSSTEIPALYGTLNTRTEDDKSMGGLNYNYGAQYSFDFGEGKQRHLVLGYSASASSRINVTQTHIVSQYTYSNGVENLATDTLVNQQKVPGKVQLPQINHFGISYQYDQHFLIGADYTMGHWSALSIAGVNQGFQDSKTYNIGAQFTPNANSLHNYFSRTDYRIGFMYDDSYLNIDNTTITTKAVTFGFGLPLSPNLSTFYKINFSAELGQRGTLGTVAAPLVKENFIDLHLSFTLNDKWFQRFKFQ